MALHTTFIRDFKFSVRLYSKIAIQRQYKVFKCVFIYVIILNNCNYNLNNRDVTKFWEYQKIATKKVLEQRIWLWLKNTTPTAALNMPMLTNFTKYAICNGFLAVDSYLSLHNFTD